MAPTKPGNRCIAILREVKNKWERRCPLTPAQVSRLVTNGVKVLVQPSQRRIFSDGEFEAAGAILRDDISEAATIFGVKEFPKEQLLAGRSYVIFSHTIKAQQENMAFLDECLTKDVRLFDYECIKATPADGGQRIVFFGHFAGVAGMIDMYRGLGERMLSLGCQTPFMGVSSCYSYPSLETAKDAVRAMGSEIARVGLPEQFSPMVFAFTGNGNVSKGAQEMLELLPHEFVTVDQLPEIKKNGSRHKVYGVVCDADELVERSDGQAFDFQHYFDNPEAYRPTFHERVAPYTNCIVNAMYWDRRFPRVLTIDQMQALQEQSPNQLLGVADISADKDGSIEFLKQITQLEKPFFRYDPGSDLVHDELDGDGVCMLAVDNLPAEFPREASEYFANALEPFVSELASSNGSIDFDQQTDLASEMKVACITCNGQLTPNFRYISALRQRQEQQRKIEVAQHGAHAGATLEGHLFDTGLINHCLDLIESKNSHFEIIDVDAGMNHSASERELSRATLHITAPDDESLEAVMVELEQLTSVFPLASGKLKRLPFAALKTTQQQQEDESQSSTPSTPVFSGPRRRVLVLGSGMVAAPLVEYLSKAGNEVLVCGNDEHQARTLCEPFDNAQAMRLNAIGGSAGDRVELDAQVRKADVVISLLPATAHVPVAELCIEHGTDLVTASYISPEMRSLHDRARDAGITIMNEVGLDPGLDHMSALQVIDEIRADGGTMTAFESVCGGLPAPEAANNPLGYKFSWNPRGVLTASGNAAQFLRDGQEVRVAGDDLLQSALPANLNPAFSLEHLPNRDSLPYRATYGLDNPELQTMYRGTLRYAGFSETMHKMRQVGLFETSASEVLQQSGSEQLSWAEFMARQLGAQSDLQSSVESRLGDGDHSQALEAMRWLGLFSEDQQVTPVADNTPISAFCALLEDKLAYGPQERDLCLMQHRFGFVDAQGKPRERTSTLVSYGEPGGHSAMARTVGLPAAVAAQRILDGKFSRKGVMAPVFKDLYEPCLAELQDMGINFQEEQTL